MKGVSEGANGYWSSVVEVPGIEDVLEYGFVLGAQNMKDDPMLSSEHGGQLYAIHKVDVPGLEFKQDKVGYLEDRWLKREANGAGQHFASYFHKDGIVRSVVSGTMKDGGVYVINAVTLNEFRGKGYGEALLSITLNFIKTHLPQNRYINGVIGTGAGSRHGVHGGLKEEDFDKINKNARKIKQLSDPLAKVYGDVMGMSVQSIKDFADGSEGVPNEHARKLYNAIPMEPRDPAKKFDRLAQRLLREEGLSFGPDLATGIGVNFSPNTPINEHANSVALRKVKEFAIKRNESFQEKIKQKKASDAAYVGFSKSN